MAKYSEFPIEDLGQGVDSYSSLDSIPPGLTSELKDFDPKSNQTASLRKGYQRFYGMIPLRAQKITKSGTTISLTFDSSTTITLAEAGSGPLLVSGKIPDESGVTGSGDFSDTFNTVWYSGYELSFRETFSSGTGVTKEKSTDITGFTSDDAFIGVAEATSLSDSSNLTFWPGEVRINKSSFSPSSDADKVIVTYDSPTSFQGYFYYLELPSESGVTYIETFSSKTTVTILASTHGLANTNILVKAFSDEGTYFVEAHPEEVTINASGDVTVDFGVSTSGKIILTTTSADKTEEFSVTSGETTLQITGVEDPFNFVAIWADVAGGRVLVIPASMSWDSATQTLDIEYDIGGITSETLRVFWKTAEFSANVITVEDSQSVSETYSIDSPQLSVYGFSHENIYKDEDGRGGHVNHIDSYRTETIDRVICGLGGNIYQSTSFSAGADDYLMPSYKITGARRLSDDFTLAPMFQPDSSGTTRTRGIIEDATIKTYAVITDVTFVSDGVVDYTFSFTSKDLITFGTEMDSNDYLTVVRCGKSVNNGTFAIQSLESDSAAECVIRVSNPSAKSSFIDESDIHAGGNVFTDKVTVTEDTIFISGDKVNATAFSEEKPIKSSLGTDVYIGNITEETAISDGVNLFLKRTSSVIPLSDNFNENTDNLVRGDTLSVTGLSRKVRIKQVNTNDSGDVSVSVVSGEASISLTAHNLNVGDKVVLTDGDSDLVGEFSITEIVDEDTFKVETDASDGAYTVNLQGHTIEIDESLTFESGPDETTLTVEGRWTSIEIPDSSKDRAVKTKEFHFDESEFSDQPYLRSAEVAGSMYLGNQKDEIKKYDGSNITNAGLPAWQPWAFLSVDTDIGSLPAGQAVNIDAVIEADKYFEVSSHAPRSGDTIQATGTGQILTVVRTVPEVSSNTVRIYTIEDITAGNTNTDQLIVGRQVRYYAKINLIDSNNQIISGATLGAEDLRVVYFQSSSVYVKLLGLPPIEEIDYDNIEVQLYRTKSNTQAPFYRAQTTLVDYNDLGGYILIHDTVPDEALTINDLDPATTGTLGQEIGPRWSQPPKASVVTTANNSLVLANIKSPPTLDVVFRRQEGVASTSTSDYSGGEVELNKTDTTLEDANHKLVFSFEDTTATINEIDPTTDLTIATNEITIDAGAAHSMSAGDWVYLFHSATGLDNLLDFSGWYRLASVTTNTFTIDVKHNRSTGSGDAEDIDRWINSSSSSLSAGLRIPVWVGDDGNFNQRFYDDLSLETLVATRLGIAINAVMATEYQQNSYWTTESLTPAPWLRAQCGLSFRTGQVVIYDLNEPNGSISLQHSGTSNVDVFVNGFQVSASTFDSSIIRIFGSRVAASYPNFVEVFDDPYSETGGPRVRDINPSDGQDVTAAVPFFGQAAFGDAQLAQALVVFKSQSVYLLDLQTMEYQKIQSQGQGCTAPRSVATTKDGIIFANDSGVYRLGWDMKVSWVGIRLAGIFDKNRNLDQTTELAGHNYAKDRRYKLSFPATGSTYNSNVAVYDFSREEFGQPGAWGEYTNHPALGWTNLGYRAFFATTTGLVMEVRDTGEIYDYRDDDGPVGEPSLITGGLHFGLPGQRKSLLYATLQAQATLSEQVGIEVLSEVDLTGTFSSCGEAEFSETDQTIKFAVPTRRGVYHRIKLSLSGVKDTHFQVSKIILWVSAVGITNTPTQKSLEGTD